MDKYLQSLKILREKFIEENDELLKKIKESEKTGEFKVTSSEQFEQFYMQDFLEVFSLPNFYFLELLQLYEELLYLYHFFNQDNFTINAKDFFKDDVFQKESFLKSADSAIEIIIAKKDIESHVKKLAEEIGIFNLDTSQQADNFVSLKQYLTAIEKAKNKKRDY
jgi:hypothetical protein